MKFPITIGGRDIDVSQIGYTLLHELKEVFPPNEIPTELLRQAYDVLAILERAEQGIENFILVVREHKDQQDFMNQ